MASPLSLFAYLQKNLNGLTSFCFEIFFQLLYKNKQTEVEKWHQISGEPVSIEDHRDLKRTNIKKVITFLRLANPYSTQSIKLAWAIMIIYSQDDTTFKKIVHQKIIVWKGLKQVYFTRFHITNNYIFCLNWSIWNTIPKRLKFLWAIKSKASLYIHIGDIYNQVFSISAYWVYNLLCAVAYLRQ